MTEAYEPAKNALYLERVRICLAERGKIKGPMTVVKYWAKEKGIGESNRQQYSAALTYLLGTGELIREEGVVRAKDGARPRSTPRNVAFSKRHNDELTRVERNHGRGAAIGRAVERIMEEDPGMGSESLDENSQFVLSTLLGHLVKRKGYQVTNQEVRRVMEDLFDGSSHKPKKD